MMFKYIFVLCSLTLSVFSLDKPSFEEFDRKARNKEALSVVFFGGSLTWGANASDPNKTSYRGRMMDYLRQKYPETAIKFHDAAIGGTGSSLGVFRMERDVLSQKPDLVFLDFTVNDGMEGVDRQSLATYESIVHQLLSKNIAIVQMLLSCGYHQGEDAVPSQMFRRIDHLKIGKRYKLAIADTYPFMNKRLQSGEFTIPQLWPFELTHPDDQGYKIFFEVARDAFETAVSQKKLSVLPEEKMYSEIYNRFERRVLSKESLAENWVVAKTYRTSMWYDGLSSRWIDNVVMFDAKGKVPVKSIKLNFTGSMLGLIGESNHDGLTFKIKIDGEYFHKLDNRTNTSSEVWNWNTARFGKGNLFRWLCISKDLSNKEHTLEIIPIVNEQTLKGQFRIESICIASE